MPMKDKIAENEFILTHTYDTSPKRQEFSIHIHDNYEILCFLSGNAEYMVEGKIYNLRPGSIMIMRSAETHKLLLNTNEAYERYIINFYPEKLIRQGFPEELFLPFTERSLGSKNLYLPEEFIGISPETVFEKMFTDISSVSQKQRVLINLAFLLSAINTAFTKKRQSESTKKRHSSNELIDYINANLCSDLSLSKISEAMHISPSQINRIFRKLTGTSVYNYIISKRLVVAQELIAKGENASVASQKCGFHDYSSFYRLYKKHFGIAPTDSKKEIPTIS